VTPTKPLATVDKGARPATMVSALRPRQWTKNLLVVAAPLFAGEVTTPGVVLATTATFVAFCLGSSAVYLLNDICDVDLDRVHPLKRYRAVAAGAVSLRTAAIASVLLAGAGAVVTSMIGWPVLAVYLTYVGLNIAYSLRLKNEPVLDIALIAAGFLLRAIAGGTANDIALSQWFLLIAAFGSLFVAAGKRYGEVCLVGAGEASTRVSLARYSATYLRFVWTLSAAVLVMSYSLWSFEITHRENMPWAAGSMVPFVLGVLRYAIDVDSGAAGEPEDLAFGDRVLQLIGMSWLLLVAVAVYA
jgi:decaprenyl-phosphate phosphoribosyltransferase